MASFNHSTVPTSLGPIAVFHNFVPGSTPVLLLHGIYFDHELWHGQLSVLKGHTVVALDMPLHGASQSGIRGDWTLEDCGRMVLEVMDQLAIDRAVGIGQSWGSMSLLRAASMDSQRFVALGLCNMPFKESSKSIRLRFRLLNLLAFFPRFYARQAAGSMMGKEILKDNPQLGNFMVEKLGKMKPASIRQVHRAVILRAKDATSLIANLQVPTWALRGEEDYVPNPPGIPLKVVQGGHVSPLEVPAEVNDWLKKLLEFATQTA